MLRILQLCLSALITVVAIVIVVLWWGAGDGFVIPGAIVGGAATVLLLIPGKERPALIWTIVLYVLVAGFNVLMFVLGVISEQLEGMTPVLVWQTAWAVLGLAILVVDPLRERSELRARRTARLQSSAASALAAERERIEAVRARELLHAEHVARVAAAVDTASSPGDLTGYEPQELARVVLDRPSHMHGDPGTGLSGAGFDAWRVKRGQEGEVNFAKALRRDGLLEEFATFWSVHMPDETIGASGRTQADVDCVLASGNTLWLIDVKNYQQGGVVWRTETHPGRNSSVEDVEVLAALDRETGGYVGRPHEMTRNMARATERFSRRLSASGLAFSVVPVVVMMPQRDGLGTIEQVSIADGVEVLGLPRLLERLRAERPFEPHTEDARVLTAILTPLLKDESGSAIILDPATGRRRAPEPGIAQPRDPFGV